MLTRTYQVEVLATPEVVWQVLTEKNLYEQWAKAFSPRSQFEGEWEEGNSIYFFDPDLGGTRAIIDRIEEYREIEYTHVAISNPEHVKDLDSDTAQKWIGTREHYQITPNQESVSLKVVIDTHPDFVDMLDEGWKKAFPLIKVISEQQGR
ncbi:SRPBCC domain-containing protein [Vibrio pectenicida]|uniref:SRPBCC domain-containing protein n=1 Tax=Vibrio pectenicida TaxID=62763 RepID=A0A427U4A9_9VIBR|nr:SRPBCC domain-containing protein [Vibrio pectenicida]NOH71204.1 SRPBCC domain-containing protein [Vibrio pectenicida]RSD31506.1 SRPBCC domain-containing protein [Vibrio pectenicida]